MMRSLSVQALSWRSVGWKTLPPVEPRDCGRGRCKCLCRKTLWLQAACGLTRDRWFERAKRSQHDRAELFALPLAQLIEEIPTDSCDMNRCQTMQLGDASIGQSGEGAATVGLTLLSFDQTSKD